MTRVALRLLGPPCVELEGEAVHIGRRKALALLAYLLVTARPHTRDALATLFWPERDHAGARAGLRQSLSALNTSLGNTLLAVDRESVRPGAGSDPWLDVDEFRRLLRECERHSHDPAAECHPCRTRLVGAVELYRDDFLSGFSLRDCPGFDEWQRFETEGLRDELSSVLGQLAWCESAAGAHEAAIQHARRRAALDPLHERAQGMLMEVYEQAGQRSAALRQYREYARRLEAELGVVPSPELTDLYELIGTGRLDSRARLPEPVARARLPLFLSADADVDRPVRPLFVARERGLERLDGFLDAALAGPGGVAFVTGEAGTGKTALVREFAERARMRHEDLAVAGGNCNAQSGIGDPYLPFRTIMGFLTGDVETAWDACLISTSLARRLWGLVPSAVAAVVDSGPDLIDSFLSGRELLARATAAAPRRDIATDQLSALVAKKGESATLTDLSQRDLFEQYTAVLRTLAVEGPILLVVDDLQWADVGTTSLLFHLGRRIEGSPILILGIYRRSEVALGRGGERHPLEPVLAELKRRLGDVWVDLTETDEGEGRRFVEAYLDTQPNRLGQRFRRSLFAHTAGHPLFTIELLRAMQDRGDLVQDQYGRWVEGRALDWRTIPARVEGVIGERIARLDEDQRETLTIASVEGEDFTAEVIAAVRGVPERGMMRDLSQELGKRHRLVREREEARVGVHSLSSYGFCHALYQQFLYDGLGTGERRLLHGKVGEALEILYGERAQKIAVPLAHHFTQAEIWDQAYVYHVAAGDQARRAYANQEALAHYTKALEVSEEITPALNAAQLLPAYEGRGVVLRLLRKLNRALSDFEMMRQMAGAAGDQQKEGESLFNLASVHYWIATIEEIPHQERYGREAVRLAQLTGDQRTLARSLTIQGMVDQAHGEIPDADTKMQSSLQISRRERFRDSVSENLRWLGAHAAWRGHYDQAVTFLQEGLAIARDINDGLGELMGLSFLSLAQANAGSFGAALKSIQEARAKAEDLGNPFFVSRQPNHQGWIHRLFGDLSGAEELDAESAELGGVPGIPPHAEISALINLGSDYLGKGQCERSRTHLEEVLERVEAGQFGAHEFLWTQRLHSVLGEACHEIGDHEEALRHADESLSIAVAHSSRKYRVKGWALRGRILAGLGESEAAGADLLRAFDLAEKVNSPSLTYPIAYDLGRWHERAGRHEEASSLYARAKASIDRMVNSVDDQALRSTFLQSEAVQAVKERLARVG